MSELIEAMKEVNDLNRTRGVTQRGGKKYTEVFVRVEAFRKAYGTTMGINTDIIVDDGQKVIIKAQVVNDKGMTIGSGYAEEIRGSSNVNRTSALENAETSAIGRALASLGLHGGSYASNFEVGVAQHNDAVITQIEEQAKSEAAPTQGDPVRDQWTAWVESMCDQYTNAPTLRALHDIDRSTPDETLDALKEYYPDLHTRLVTHFTQQEGTKQ